MGEIIMVLIINTKYVRWELLDDNITFRDLYIFLNEKYKIGKSIMEIGDLYINKFSNDKLIELCEKNETTIKIMTKDKNYKLSYDIQ